MHKILLSVKDWKHLTELHVNYAIQYKTQESFAAITFPLQSTSGGALFQRWQSYIKFPDGMPHIYAYVNSYFIILDFNKRKIYIDSNNNENKQWSFYQ